MDELISFIKSNCGPLVNLIKCCDYLMLLSGFLEGTRGSRWKGQHRTRTSYLLILYSYLLILYSYY